MTDCVRFDDPAVTYHPHNHACWELVDDWWLELPGHWDFRYLTGGRLLQLHVPAGFTFDLASVPRPLWWLIAPFELSIAAPLSHDYLYRRKIVSRRTADKLFRYVMRCEEVAGWRRWSAWVAVRVFGRVAWTA